MRWNGAGNDTGYPNRGRYPVWFMLPEDLSISIVKGLLGARSADQKALLEVLEDLRVRGALKATRWSCSERKRANNQLCASPRWWV
jgi:hypothetical protein